MKANLINNVLEATDLGDLVPLERAWKALLAADGYLLWNLELKDHGKKQARALRQVLAERLEMARAGAWGSLHDDWLRRPMPEGGNAPGADENLEQTATRVRQLVEVGELQRASARVWGAAPLAHGQDLPRRAQELFPTESAEVPPACRRRPPSPSTTRWR